MTTTPSLTDTASVEKGKLCAHCKNNPPQTQGGWYSPDNGQWVSCQACLDLNTPSAVKQQIDFFKKRIAYLEESESQLLAENRRLTAELAAEREKNESSFVSGITRETIRTIATALGFNESNWPTTSQLLDAIKAERELADVVRLIERGELHVRRSSDGRWLVGQSGGALQCFDARLAAAIKRHCEENGISLASPAPSPSQPPAAEASARYFFDEGWGDIAYLVVKKESANTVYKDGFTEDWPYNLNAALSLVRNGRMREITRAEAEALVERPKEPATKPTFLQPTATTIANALEHGEEIKSLALQGRIVSALLSMAQRYKGCTCDVDDCGPGNCAACEAKGVLGELEDAGWKLPETAPDGGFTGPGFHQFIAEMTPINYKLRPIDSSAAKESAAAHFNYRALGHDTTFTDALKIMRLERGLGLREFTELCRIQPSHYAAIENRTAVVSREEFDSIVTVLEAAEFAPRFPKGCIREQLELRIKHWASCTEN